MAVAFVNIKKDQASFSTALGHTINQIHDSISPTMSWRCNLLQTVTGKLQTIELAIRMTLYEQNKRI